MNWESKFQNWAKPPSKTEKEKCDNAERVVGNSIKKTLDLEDRNIRIFSHGSYRHRTNIRMESDVDICAMCTDSIFFNLPEGMTPSDFGIPTPPSYPYSEYKNDVEKGLKDYFGDKSVKRGNKAFDIYENTYRVDADVVACFEHRRYSSNGTYLEGMAFLTDKGWRIVNWPDQNYENGVEKNKNTNYRFKSIVRILKQLRNEMNDNGIVIAGSTPSYLIECLVWNVPNKGFGHDTYTADIRWVLAYLFNNTRKFNNCKEWGEINELKYLFRATQQWTLEQAYNFLSAAWDYIGFK